MSQVDLAIANAILKEDYLGPIRSAVNVATPVWDRIEKNSRDIVGKEAWIPVEMALNQGAGARGENGVLPTAGTGEYKELKVQLAYYYGSMAVTGPTMRQTAKGERGSFGRIVDVEAKGMKKLLKTLLAHDTYKGDELAKTKAGAADTTVLMEDGAADDTNMEYFKKNMLVDVIAADQTTVLLAGAKIVSVDKAVKSIVLDGAVTEEAGGKVVRTATLGQTIVSLEEIISATTDIYGVTTANYEEWKATENLTFGSFSVKKFQDELDKVSVFSGKAPTAIYGDFAKQNLYFQTLTANPRYLSGEGAKTLDGGFKSLTYTGGGAPIPWIADRLAPANTLLCPHEPDLQLFSPGEFDFIDIGGDVWLPDILGATPKDNWKAVLFRDIQMGAYNRNSHLKLKEVTA